MDKRMPMQAVYDDPLFWSQIHETIYENRELKRKKRELKKRIMELEKELAPKAEMEE